MNVQPPASGERTTFGLMGVAALLIVNSHLEPLYPRSFMAADGLLGNLIFFVLAGYGVALGQLKQRSRLTSFFGRRVWRIYPSLGCAVLMGWATGAVAFPGADPLAWLKTLFWPTGYGFISQIMVFYPVLWWLGGLSLRGVQWAVGVLAVIWFGIWMLIQQTPNAANLSLGLLPLKLWWSFFLTAAALGSLLARSPGSGRTEAGGGTMIGLGILYLGLKFELALRICTTPAVVSSALLGGLLQGLALGVVAVLVVRWPDWNAQWGTSGLRRSMEWVGQASLQFYLLHGMVLHWVERLPVPWPVRILLVVGITAVLSGVLVALLRRWPVPWTSAGRESCKS